jgi:hypothetical protein
MNFSHVNMVMTFLPAFYGDPHIRQPQRLVVDDHSQGKVTGSPGHLLKLNLYRISRPEAVRQGTAQNEREAEDEFGIHHLLDADSMLNTPKSLKKASRNRTI